MLTWLSGRLIGQDDARSAAVRMKTMALSKLKDGEKAAGLYYLIGEPGVGKTELVKLLAEFIHGDRRAYVKIDGGTMQDKYQANRLIGSPPGYLGYEEPDKAAARQAEEAAEAAKDPESAARKHRKNPRKLLCRQNLIASRHGSGVPITILFIDEAEKLFETIDDLFLNAVEDGMMPLGDNEEVEFGDVLVIYAGNPGSKDAVNRKARIGFLEESAQEREETTRDIIMDALKVRYRPEMLDRFDEFVYFKKLGKEDLRSITALRINEVVDRFMVTMSRGTAFTVKVEETARNFMLEEALKNTGNARRIGRAVRKYFTNPLNRLIAQSEDSENELLVTSDDLVIVSHDPAYHDGKLLKFELYEDEGVRAPQDTIAPSKNDTPLALKHAGFDRQLTAAAEMAKKESKNVYAVALDLDTERLAMKELLAAREESSSILRMKLVEFKARTSAPWTITLYFEATEKQSDLLKKHFPTGSLTFVSKAAEAPVADAVKGPGKNKTGK
jgi:MoxR-like ATPase